MPLLIRLPHVKRSSNASSYLNAMDRNKTAVQRQLRRGGLAGYEPEFMATMMTLWEDRQRQARPFVFFDVGAHIGLYSALAEKLFDAECYAFEATPETARDAKHLRKENRLTYPIVGKAVSSHVGEIKFYLSRKAETSNSANEAFRPGGEEITVESISLDAFTSDKFPDPDIVKIDVETHEPDVILGAVATISRARPTIACEFLPHIDLARLAEALTELEGMGYKFLRILPETPWKPLSITELLGSLNSDKRDWLLTPDDLLEAFYRRREAWKVALSKCGPDTNLLVESKKDAEKRQASEGRENQQAE